MTQRPAPVLDRVLDPLREFFRWESAGGLCLMAAAVLALVVANSPLEGAYADFLELPVALKIGSFAIAKPLLLWINDGLMAVFFFLVGLELKREILVGHLSSLRRAGLPFFAAVGGMAAPALVYFSCNRGDAMASRGWAIPTATDIAFALGVLSLLGSRVPPALKAFLLSVAIFDDLGAVIVIALFYTAQLATGPLVVAAVLIAGLALLNRFRVQRTAAYLLLGIPLWVAVLKSGVHATLAGVVVALFVPLRAPQDAAADGNQESLLARLEHALHPWVAFGVLPVFAFSNAGVSLSGLGFGDTFRPVPLGIMAGLFLGKQVGVLGFSWLAVRLGLAARPEGVTWRQLHGIAVICGIGFTMSLFIASLAFESGSMQPDGLERLGILVGSLVSGLIGFVLLRASFTSREGAT